MRITQEADYALRIIYHLAREERICDAKTIAQAVCVPERFTVKILRKLVLGKLIRSHKGAAGGYELAFAPNELSMKRVVETIDGPLEISRCLDSSYECTRSGSSKQLCTFHLIFEKLNRNLSDKLDSITIDLIASDQLDIDEILAKI